MAIISSESVQSLSDFDRDFWDRLSASTRSGTRLQPRKLSLGSAAPAFPRWARPSPR